MVPLSIPAFEEPVDYDFRDIRDTNSKLIKLDENVSVLMFRESVTLIRTTTTTGDILQHKQLEQQPLGICRWTDERFIVVFGKEMMVFNRDLCCLNTIKTEKYYSTIYKYNDNQLVCGGHYISDLTEDERNNNYRKKWYNEKFCFLCDDNDAYGSYYVDVVDIKDGKCKDEVCHGKMARYKKLKGEALVDDVGVTSFGDVVVVRREGKKKDEDGEWVDDLCFVEWFREKSLVRRIRIKDIFYVGEFCIQTPHLHTIGEYVYITDTANCIYQIPGHVEQQTSEEIEVLKPENIQNYLLLRWDDNEVFEVLGFDVSENSLMVFGIIPGRQSFAFFHYDK
ncbi:Hypothetical predicted protein [Octopus vulgaris]|uniref:Uncharacterized protein n=1 Tax=Octopus vulgaris TaxID=6645 RepID=A0AA36BYB2_OCTVU|nr:Hypothetical predicted protein [Octopus vulgaris]